MGDFLIVCLAKTNPSFFYIGWYLKSHPLQNSVPPFIDVNKLQVLGKIFHIRNKNPKGHRVNFFQTLLGKEESMQITEETLDKDALMHNSSHLTKAGGKTTAML